MVTITVLARGFAPENTCPAGAAGFAGPNPVSQRGYPEGDYLARIGRRRSRDITSVGVLRDDIGRSCLKETRCELRVISVKEFDAPAAV